MKAYAIQLVAARVLLPKEKVASFFLQAPKIVGVADNPLPLNRQNLLLRKTSSSLAAPKMWNSF